jgi:uncharacterized protein (TIGR02271 family)
MFGNDFNTQRNEDAMSVDDQTWTIYEGSDVLGSDGEKVGTVDGVEETYIIVRKGWFFPTDYYIPVEAISAVTQDQVTLTVTKDEALNQGWEAVPDDAVVGGYVADGPNDIDYTDDTLEGGYVADDTLLTDTGVVDTGTVTNETEQPFEHHTSGDTTHIDESDTIRVPLAEEELTATRRPVERGQVHVDKEVISEERTLDVPVTEERVTVNRRVVDRDLQPDDAVFEEGTIEVPVRGEEVDVEKQARVREELEISKEAVQQTKRVSDTVRRERAHVTDTSETVDGDELLEEDVDRR